MLYYEMIFIIYIVHLVEIHMKIFSKSVFDIKMRLMVNVELGTKWMPSSDSASHFMLQYKFLGH